MQIRLIAIEKGRSATPFVFEQDTLNIGFIPQVGDMVLLPDMAANQIVKSRTFVYKKPDSLEILFEL